MNAVWSFDRRSNAEQRRSRSVGRNVDESIRTYGHIAQAPVLIVDQDFLFDDIAIVDLQSVEPAGS